MNVEDMTPEQLRAYAAEKEMAHAELLSRYMDEKVVDLPTKDEKMPWEMDVVFEGEVYRVDMRRMKSREFMKMYAAARKSGANDGSYGLSEMLEMFEYVFKDIDGKVTDVVTAKLGYDDFEEHYRIESALLELTQAKN